MSTDGKLCLMQFGCFIMGIAISLWGNTPTQDATWITTGVVIWAIRITNSRS